MERAIYYFEFGVVTAPGSDTRSLGLKDGKLNAHTMENRDANANVDGQTTVWIYYRFFVVTF